MQSLRHSRALGPLCSLSLLCRRYGCPEVSALPTTDALHRHRISDTMTMSTHPLSPLHPTQKSAPEIDALLVNMYYIYNITFVVVPATLTI